MTAEFARLKRSTGANYGLLIDVHAVVDPEVLIDTGLVFEQESLNGVQTLAAAAGKVAEVDVGRPFTVMLPAWCLNQNLSPPRGESIRPTPFYLPLPADTSQEAVWLTLERSRDSSRASG